ncbi:MAG: hypothetical protein DCC57_19510 [Chloroflexi bacterium]|nr:MAG: hypothetical protein DCC57_19510 [Chloroflexota bacterium]
MPAVPRAVNWADSPTEIPAVRRIDHIIIRVDDALYDEFYALFADTLRLPTPWPPTEHPTMRSGGLFAGNVDFEILHIPDGPYRDQAHLYGIAFEAWGDDASVLDSRGIDYLPAPYLRSEPGKPPAMLWMNYFFGPFLGSTAWLKALFALKKLIPDPLWMRNAAQRGASPRAVEFMFNDVYRQGMVFMVKYNPAWRNINAERRISAAQMAARQGGALGLRRVKEVVVGSTQLTASSSRWRALLRPAPEKTALCWQVGDGPAIRVIAADSDGLHHMVWEVDSLAQARAALEELGMLGVVMQDEITIHPDTVFGLDIRLVGL